LALVACDILCYVTYCLFKAPISRNCYPLCLVASEESLHLTTLPSNYLAGISYVWFD